MPNGIIAQNNTFENFFGLDSHELNASYDAEESIESLRHEKEPEIPLEIEEFNVEEKDLNPIEKKDDEIKPTEILPEPKNDFAAKDESKKKIDLPFVQTISAKVTDEKNGKYVRYGK